MTQSIKIKAAEKKHGKGSDNYCHHCGDDNLINYPSLHKKQCSNCCAFIDWYVSESGVIIEHQR